LNKPPNNLLKPLRITKSILAKITPIKAASTPKNMISRRMGSPKSLPSSKIRLKVFLGSSKTPPILSKN